MDAQQISNILTADFPAQIQFVPPLVLLVLAIVSFVDARTGRVPDVPVVGAFLGTFFALAYYGGWLRAAEHFAYAAAAVLALRFFNHLYLQISKHDAFGFGDAKWTGLAVLAYGYKPVIAAWVIGAWLALIWMGLRKIWRRFSSTYEGHEYVHFAPFLFFGLIAALFVVIPRL